MSSRSPSPSLPLPRAVAATAASRRLPPRPPSAAPLSSSSFDEGAAWARGGVSRSSTEGSKGEGNRLEEDEIEEEEAVVVWSGVNVDAAAAVVSSPDENSLEFSRF